jgi:asparagine synthase (glutamine-hydrolysing)
LSDRALERGIFDPEFVRRLVQRHQLGEDHSERLWALVNFEMWQRQFIDGECVGNWSREPAEALAVSD